MYTHENYLTWKVIRQNARVCWMWDELDETAAEGYKTLSGHYDFMLEVGNYLFRLHCGEKVPHMWDKLVNRAKSHGCNHELRELKRVFETERLHALRFANESTEEFELNHRGEL